MATPIDTIVDMVTLDDVVRSNQITGRGFDDNGRPRALTAREFFDVSVEMGLNQSSPTYCALFENLARWVQGVLPQVRSTLEIGAGPGYFVQCLAKLGIDSQGIDGNSFSREFFVRCHPESAHRYALDPEFTGDYGERDALLSIEVFEHIPDPALHSIMEKVRTKVRAKFIVFSSTPYADPHEGWDIQWGHINLKPAEQWDAFFAQYGYLRANVRPPVTPWAALYFSREFAVATNVAAAQAAGG